MHDDGGDVWAGDGAGGSEQHSAGGGAGGGEQQWAGDGGVRQWDRRGEWRDGGGVQGRGEIQPRDNQRKLGGKTTGVAYFVVG